MHPTALTDADLDEFMAGPKFSPAFSTKARPPIPLHECVTATGPLDATHVTAMNAVLESGAHIGASSYDPAHNTLKALRHTHHRLAQMLAGGMDETIAATLCNYTIARVGQLKANPAFQELLAYYKNTVDVAFMDFATASAELGKDFLMRLQEVLDESPEKFSPSQLLEAYRLIADRTGHAPVNRSVNVNVNHGIGDKLRLSRERAVQAYITDADVA
jgi:hypothetical protein